MWLVARDGLLEGAVPRWSYYWAFDGWRFAVMGVPLFLFAFLVSPCKMNGKADGRWLGTSPCDNERTTALRKNALPAYEGKSSELIPPGPRSRVGTGSGTSPCWSPCAAALLHLCARSTGICCERVCRFVPRGLSALLFSH